MFAVNPYVKPLRLAERDGLSKRSYPEVLRAELGMAQTTRDQLLGTDERLI
jgi:hypothetical protein